jgi:hypothetical protein
MTVLVGQPSIDFKNRAYKSNPKFVPKVRLLFLIHPNPLRDHWISQHRSHTPSVPSLLLVAQPDDSLQKVKGEIEVIQALMALNTHVTDLILEEITGGMAVQGLQDHRFDYFSCQLTFEAAKPFDSSSSTLRRDERLTLPDIVRSRLPASEFAFFSACHTAELSDKSSAKEPCSRSRILVSEE